MRTVVQFLATTATVCSLITTSILCSLSILYGDSTLALIGPSMVITTLITVVTAVCNIEPLRAFLENHDSISVWSARGIAVALLTWRIIDCFGIVANSLAFRLLTLLMFTLTASIAAQYA